jgi:hypothetical protein
MDCTQPNKPWKAASSFSGVELAIAFSKRKESAERKSEGKGKGEEGYLAGEILTTFVILNLYKNLLPTLKSSLHLFVDRQLFGGRLGICCTR